MPETPSLTIVVCVLQAGTKWGYQLTFRDSVGGICHPIVWGRANWHTEHAAYAAGCEELEVQLAVRRPSRPAY